MYGIRKFNSLMNSACPSFGFLEALLPQISTALRLAGRLVQIYMEITTQDSSPTGLATLIKPRVATTCCAQALFKSTIKLQWGRASTPFRAIGDPNMISAYLSGRTRKRETGGCSLGMTTCSDTGQHFCFPTCRTVLLWSNGEEKW